MKNKNLKTFLLISLSIVMLLSTVLPAFAEDAVVLIGDEINNEESEDLTISDEGPDKGPALRGEGPYMIGSTSYATLQEAINAVDASAETIIKVLGDTSETANVITIEGKKITLISDGNHTISGLYYNVNKNTNYIEVKNGGSLTLGSGNTSNVLTLKGIHVFINDSNLVFQDGVEMLSNEYPQMALSGSIIHVKGSSATAKFTGGVIKNSEAKNYNNFHTSYGVIISDGAKVSEISGGEYTNHQVHAFFVKGQGTKVEKITGGIFENSVYSGGTGSALWLEEKAQIGEIEEGKFISHRLGGLSVKSGAYIEKISGGTFENPLDNECEIQNEQNQRHMAGLVVNLCNDAKVKAETGIGEITGGTFTGINGLLVVSEVPDFKAKIGEISGGTFKAISHDNMAKVKTFDKYNEQHGIYNGFNGYIEEISNCTATGKFGILNYGKIDKIIGGRFEGDDGALLNTKLNYAIVRESGQIGVIENGEFIVKDPAKYAIQTDGKIEEIKSGVFWGGILNDNGRNKIKLESPLNIDQPLIGNGRYYHKENKNFYDLTKVYKKFLSGTFELPKYKTKEGYEYEYVPSNYKNNYGVWESGKAGFYKSTKDTTLNKEEYLFWAIYNPFAYFNTVKKEGYYFGTANDYFKDYDRKEERIYGLYPEYTNDGLKKVDLNKHNPESYMMAYLRKRPVLRFDANLPKDIKYTGNMPKDQHMVPFAWDNSGTTIKYDEQGGHWEQVFLVPKEPGIKIDGANPPKFLGWNTKADGTGRNLKLDKFYAMPVEDVTLYAIWDIPTPPPAPKPTEPTTLILTLDENHRGGEITNIEVEEGDLIEPHLYIPRRRGYIFKGWSYDRKHLDEVKPEDRIYSDTTLYAIWKRAEEEKVEEPEEIKGEDHKAYIFGYPNGTVRPNGSITRAEAAAMLARLLNIEAIGSAAKPQFTDTESSWYNKAINAVVFRGIMKGYPDGRFRPNAPITRAEFTQMISTIDNKPYGVAPFADVPGHWAERAIGSEYQAKRITGYPDGLFRPDANITRAEAAVILNKIFERKYDNLSLLKCKNPQMIKRFTDLNESFWGWNDMVEATNTHEFIRREKNMVQEDWLLIK